MTSLWKWRCVRAALLVVVLSIPAPCPRPVLGDAAAGDDDRPEDARPVWCHGGTGGDCSFSPDGGRVLATDERHAVVLDAATGRPITPHLRHENLVYHAAFSPDGKRVVTASADGTARVWDAAGGKELARLRHPEWVRTAAFSPDGAKVVTAGGDRTARVWDATTGKQVLSLAHEDAVVSAAFSPDGAKLLTVGRLAGDGAYLWDAATGERLLGPLRLEGVSCAAFSRDGKKVVTGDEVRFDRIACVWDAATGKLLAKTGKHWGQILSVAFSPDGSKVATGSDGYVRVWDAATGKPLTQPLGDRVSMMRVAVFSPDGTRVLGAGEGAQAAVWEIATGKVVARAGERDAYTSAAFDPKGTRFVVAGVNVALDRPPDPAVCVWRVPPPVGRK